MAGTISLGHVTPLLQIILLIVTVIWSAEGTNSSLPCPVINERTGAMLCCPSMQPKIMRPIGRRCTAVLPKNAFPLMTESWTVEAFNIYHQNWRHELDLLRPTKRYRMCCCKEESDLILPGLAHAVSGKRRKVVQHLMGYVQPILSTTCKESFCMKIKNRRRNFFNCFQRWTTKALYIEDPVYEDFIRLERIKVPSGCICKIMSRNESLNMERASYESESSNTTSGNDGSELKDSVVSKIPVSDDPGDIPFDNEVAGLVGYDFNKFNLPSESEHEIPVNSQQEDPYDTVEYHFNYTNSSFYQQRPTDLYNLSFSSSSSDSFQHPPSILNRPETSYDSFQDSYNYQNLLDGINDGTEYESSSDFNVSPNRPFQIPSDYYNINPGATEDAANRQKYLSNSSTNQQQFALGSLVPSGQLSNANSLLSSSQSHYAHKVSSYANNLNLSMDKYLKMGLLSGSLGKMSTSQIVENVLKKVDGTRQMQVLTMAERLMQLEIEYLGLSMEMMDIGFRHLKSPGSVTSAPKLSFANNPAVDHIPIIFKPGVDRPTIVATSELDGTTFSGDASQSIPVPSWREETLFPKEDILTHEGNNNPEGTLSPVKQAGILPASLEAESPPPNTSRIAINMMIEDALYSALVNFLFQQAWMKETCTVPLAIDQYNTELYFLPSLVKDKFNVEAKGTLNINKFASRVIAGIIMCHIVDPEKALLDGRLARAISIGIKVAQLLNNRIRIMKETMRGILDTDDAKTMVSLLRWASQPTGVPATEVLGSSKNATDVDNLLAVVKDSLSEYVDFLKAKASKKDVQKPPVPSNSSGSGSTNLGADSATLANTTKGNAVKPSSALQNSTITTDKTNGIQELATASSTSSVNLLLPEENVVEDSSLIPVRKDQPTTSLPINSLASPPATIVSINTTTDKSSQNIETSMGTSPTIPVVIKTMNNRTTIVDHESLIPTTTGPKIPVGDLKAETNVIFALADTWTESTGTVKTTIREGAGFQTLAMPDAITTTKKQKETQDKFRTSTMPSDTDNEGSDIKSVTTTKVPYSTKGEPALPIRNLIGMTVDLTAITSENAVNRATEKSTDIPDDTKDYEDYEDYEYNDYGYEDEILIVDGYGPSGTNGNHGSKGDEYGGYGSKGGEYGGYGSKGDEYGGYGSKGDEYGGYGSKGGEYGGYGSKGDKYGDHDSKGDEYEGYGSKGDKYGDHGSKGDAYGGYGSKGGGYGSKGDKYVDHGSKGDEYEGYGSKGNAYGGYGSKGDKYGDHGPKDDTYGNHGSKGVEYGGYGSKGNEYGGYSPKDDEYGGYSPKDDEYGGYGPKGDGYVDNDYNGNKYGDNGSNGYEYENYDDENGDDGSGDEYGDYGSDRDNGSNGYGYADEAVDYVVIGEENASYSDINPENSVDVSSSHINHENSVDVSSSDINHENSVDVSSSHINPENSVDVSSSDINHENSVDVSSSDINHENSVDVSSSDINHENSVDVSSSHINHENSVDVSSSHINHENSVEINFFSDDKESDAFLMNDLPGEYDPLNMTMDAVMKLIFPAFR